MSVYDCMFISILNKKPMAQPKYGFRASGFRTASFHLALSNRGIKFSCDNIDKHLKHKADECFLP